MFDRHTDKQPSDNWSLDEYDTAQCMGRVLYTCSVVSNPIRVQHTYQPIQHKPTNSILHSGYTYREKILCFCDEVRSVLNCRLLCIVCYAGILLKRQDK